jgi:hypothetical protein
MAEGIPDVSIDHPKALATVFVAGVVGAFLLYVWNVTAGPWLTNLIRPGTAVPQTGTVNVPGQAVNTP